MAAAASDPFAWDFSPPRSPALGDHEVPQLSRQLAGRHIALMVCGGIAAFKVPLLARALRRHGAEVTAFCSEEALRYVGAEALAWATCRPLVTTLSWRAEHLSDAEGLAGEGFDAYLVAPATYNTIGKVAAGIADGVISAALASALGRLAQGRTQVVMAPTMHGSMHQAVLEANCRRLAALGVRFLPPRDAYGKHNLPEEELIVTALCRSLSRSPLRGRRLLVTGGPTPVPIDGVRRITNRFSGRLGAAIHGELLRRGADSRLVLGDSGWRPQSWMPYQLASTYDDYRRLVLAQVAEGLEAAVFSAAVADYCPQQPVAGKIASGQATLHLDLVPTEKVIDQVAAADPKLPLVSFKFMQGVSHAELMAEAQHRLQRYALVVANRAEEITPERQVAWIVSAAEQTRVEGKQEIAAALADRLEGWWRDSAGPDQAATGTW